MAWHEYVNDFDWEFEDWAESRQRAPRPPLRCRLCKQAGVRWSRLDDDTRWILVNKADGQPHNPTCPARQF